MKLEGQRIVILGGTSGIGFAVALAAAQEKANVVIASSKAESVTNALERLPKGAQGNVVDLTKEADVERFFQDLGPFDHLVYTAGDWAIFGEYATLSLADAKRSFDVRYWGCLAAVKYALPQIRRDGSIVLTSGTSGRRPSKGWAIPASILSGVEALGRALAVELGPLRVNVVCPGMTKTEMWDGLPNENRESMYREVAGKLPVGRLAEPLEIAETYLYLMRQTYSTGEVVVVDGGSVLV
jgi:NAD(P)-dependent dehydrogenase (short-subunit alcohol dehydrogenase family)